MTIKEVYILMEKYFDGSTSLEEEKKLRNFFSNSSNNLPDDLKNYKMLFSRNDSEFISVLDSNFTEDLWNKMNLNKTKTKVVSFSAFRRVLLAAATIILMLSVYQWCRKAENKQFNAAHNQKEMTKQEAFLATKQALAFVSVKLNEGRQPLKSVGCFHRFQNVIKKNKNEVISKNIIN